MHERFGRRKYLRGLAATAIGAGLAGCAGGDGEDGGGGGNTVAMTDSLTFDPGTITVAVGETVTWENVGTTGHTVTAYRDEIPADAAYFTSGGFDSEAAAREAYPEGNVIGGASYEHAFEVAGTYDYFCIPHERAGMTGTVEVEEG